MRGRSFVLKAAIVIAALFVSLACVEAFLRAFVPQPHFFFIEFSPKGFIKTKSNFSDWIAVTPRPVRTSDQSSGNTRRHYYDQYKMHLETNSYGHRGKREHPLAKPPGIYRVMHLGGSIGLGFPVSFEESYVVQAERLLPGTQIINASTVLAHPARLLEYYKKEGHEFEADLVILETSVDSIGIDRMIFDTFGKNSFEIKALRKRGYGQYVERRLNRDLAGLDALELGSGSEDREAVSILNQVLDRSTFWYQNFHIPRLLTALMPSVGELVDSYRPELDPGLPMHDKIIRTNRYLENRISYGSTLRYLSDLHQSVRSRGMEFLFLLIPAKLGCSSPTVPEWKKLLQELDRREIQYVTLLEEFCVLEEKRERERFFLKNEAHPNALAHQVIAKKLAEEISRIRSPAPNAEDRQ